MNLAIIDLHRRPFPEAGIRGQVRGRVSYPGLSRSLGRLLHVSPLEKKVLPSSRVANGQVRLKPNG